MSVGRTIFQKVCYIITRTGVKTDFTFVEAISKETKDAITVLYNANYITERKLGNMVETVVSQSFKLNYDDFDTQDIKRTDQAENLLSRMKNTEQTEIFSTVLFTYDELLEKTNLLIVILSNMFSLGNLDGKTTMRKLSKTSYLICQCWVGATF